MSSSRNIVLHRKSGFHPTGKPVGFTPQSITILSIKLVCFDYAVTLAIETEGGRATRSMLIVLITPGTIK